MAIRIQVFVIAIGCLLLGIIFHLIRRNKLMEQYSILWIFSALVVIFLAFWRGLLETISLVIGIYYPPSALFVIAIFCGLAIALHFSVVISRLTSQNKKLAQEIGLVKNELEQVKEQLKGDSGC